MEENKRQEVTPVKKKRGNPNIANVGKRFSSERQPAQYRKSAKILTEMIKKELEGKKEIIVEGEVIAIRGGIENAKTGDIVSIKLRSATKDVLVGQLLRMAAKGNIKALEMIFDRVEGKAEQNVNFNHGDQEDMNKERFVVFSSGLREKLN